MKKDLHPSNYRLVVFQDTSNGDKFLTRSTATSDETVEFEGQTYPLINIHISSTSHPFYTGQEKLVDVEGRVDRFKARQEAASKKKEALGSKARKSATRSTKTDRDEVAKVGGGSQQSAKSGK